jgi:amino acid adenylation domain-containing protein
MPTERGAAVGYLLQYLLADAADRFPSKEAVRSDGSAMTYDALDRCTTQIARTLHELGVQRGDRVGLYVHKSMASVIGVFGIMKAGACYVPLDVNAPAARSAYILRDCGIRLVISAGPSLTRLAAVAGEGCGLEAVVLTDVPTELPREMPEHVRLVPWSIVAEQDDSRLRAPDTIDTDLAYILYTSGSTGSPKGVMISHRTILTFVNWSCEQFQLTSDDRMTSHAPLHFDLSTFDIYATIKAGGTIVLVPEHRSAVPEQLVNLLEAERISVTYLVPSVLSFMVRYGKLAHHNLEALRLVLFAGEVFPIKYLRQLVAAIPHAQYYNLYGPTETNVCTYYQVRPEDVAPDRIQPVAIGRACANIEVFAVGDQGERVTQPGVEGELWVRGSCVADGYWGDPEKTAKGFVPNPFSSRPHDIAYRTGDIVTLGPDNENWLFVGRRDHMIKSRGYRIELGEVESTFYRHEHVKEAAVVAIPDDVVGSRLRAFVVLSEQGAVSEKELMTFCTRHLPTYMIPEAIDFCDVLPKTSSGKTDRPALLQRHLERLRETAQTQIVSSSHGAP